jgi:hypothetical protein
MRNNRFSRMPGPRANWNGTGLRVPTSPMSGRELVSAGLLLLELLNSMALVKVDLSGQRRITMESEEGY